MKIELSRDSGSTWTTLYADTSNSGTKPWTVTGTRSTHCLIRVSSLADTAISDVTDGEFSIVARSLGLEAPYGGETWGIGERRAITWRSSHVDGMVKIELTLDSLGYSSFYTTLVGSRDIRFSARPWLANRVNGVNITTSMSHVLASLANGDCSGDNAVDGADQDIVTANWNSDSFTNEYADLNGDGRCNAFDLLAIRNNWKVSGDWLALGKLNSASPVMWFGDANGADLETVEVAAGEPFDVYVWMTTTSNTWFADAAVAFSTTSVEGVKAYPDDNTIELATGSPNSDLVWGDALSKYPLALSRTLGGFYKSSGGVRPYGVDFACALMQGDVQPFVGLKMAKLSLWHRLEPGDAAQISLWDDGTNTAGSLNSMFFGSKPIYGLSDSLTVTSYIADTIAEAKASPDRDEVWIKGVPVTASFSDFFYIESPDRTMGIRVDKAGHDVPSGISVDVHGVVYTNADGERYILADAVDEGGSFLLDPLALVNRDIGGSDWLFNSVTGAGQRGVLGGAGPNNIGLLVRTWGRVGETGSSFSRCRK